MSGMLTGGSRHNWSFDPNAAPPPIAAKLVTFDDHDMEEPEFERMLAIVMDRLLADLPPDQEEAVRLIHLAGLSQHKAAAIIGVTHKTAAARARRGLAVLRQRLSDSVWLADLLRGQIPQDMEASNLEASGFTSILEGLR